MLSALIKATGYLKMESLFEPIMNTFPGVRGEKNIEAFKKGFEKTQIHQSYA
jgi:Pyruvate/2-oxoacid:ferredoxin oxidoreductase gamma subunit